ncbi:TPA: hypothetical protein HA231_04490 [Candidatus Woesearchaeota archaeon]|nr:hypothetical protein [Candidatus Woesearchaeota archaeon]
MRNATAGTAILISLFLLFSVASEASQEKKDRFGCHKCTSECEQYDLLKNEYHCHGTISVQSTNIQIAPRIIDGKTYRRVANVLDGDTLTVYYGVGGKKEKVRLLGIDAPETSPREKAECFSQQATAMLKELAHNKHVLLEKDKIQKDDKDKYGRLLRYVTVLETNMTVNEQLITSGHAKTYPSLTTTVENYKKLENNAKAAKAGMWDECAKEKKTQPQPGDRKFPLKGERYGSNNIN